MIAHSYILWRQLHSCNIYNGGRARREMFCRLLRRNFIEHWCFVVRHTADILEKRVKKLASQPGKSIDDGVYLLPL